MINRNKPMELSDGTPVTDRNWPYGGSETLRDRFVYVSIEGGGSAEFDLLTGENRYKGTELGRKEIRTIRNKAEQTMIDVNKPVRTRDGCNARIVATDLRNRNGDTILALITPPDAPYEFPRSYQPDGRYVVGENSDRDLVPIPVQRTLYFNMGTAYGEPHRAAIPCPACDVLEVIVEDGEVVSGRLIPKDSPKLVRS